jgi:hypothetical protein
MPEFEDFMSFDDVPRVLIPLEKEEEDSVVTQKNFYEELIHELILKK